MLLLMILIKGNPALVTFQFQEILKTKVTVSGGGSSCCIWCTDMNIKAKFKNTLVHSSKTCECLDPTN